MRLEISHPHRPHRISTVRCHQLPCLTHEHDSSTIFNNFQTLLAAFFHRIYKVTNLATFLDKPYGSVRRCRQCCPVEHEVTVLPLSASVLCSELSDREAVHSAGHTAAEPSVKEYKTAFPSTCHLRTVWRYK